MIEIILDGIKSPVWRAFAYRMWNTFKSVILPIILSLVFLQLQANPDNIGCLMEGEFWLRVLYAVVVALVGGAIAGVDKVSRMN